MLTDYLDSLMNVYAPSVTFDSPKDIKQLKPELKAADEAFFNLKVALQTANLTLKFGFGEGALKIYAIDLIHIEKLMKEFKKCIKAIDGKRNNACSDYFVQYLDLADKFDAFSYFVLIVFPLKVKEFERYSAELKEKYPNDIHPSWTLPSDLEAIPLFKQVKEQLK